MCVLQDQTVRLWEFFWRRLRTPSNWFLQQSFLQLYSSLKLHFYCLWESLSCSFLGMEIASKLSFQHLASLSWDQLTSKVLKLYVCRCEGVGATFIRVSEGGMWVCPRLLTGDVHHSDFYFFFAQERTAAGTVRQIHVQPDGGWTQHVNHPQYPTERRR